MSTDQLSQIAVAIAAIGGLVVQIFNYRTTHRAANNIQRVETEMNSMQEKLVKATGEAAHAEGKVAGRAELQAEQKESL